MFSRFDSAHSTLIQRRSFCVLLSIAVLAGSPIGAAADKILCIGSDGHVEVEAAVNGVCSSELQHREIARERRLSFLTGTTDDDGHCGDCVDLPLIVNRVPSNIKTAWSKEWKSSQSTSHYCYRETASQAPGLLRQNGDLRPTGFLTDDLRSVFLLI